MQYPSVRRVGAEFDIALGKPRIEGFLANVRELGGPGGHGLLGLRASYPVLGRLRAGASLIADGNLYAAIADADNDGVPDPLDRFHGHDDRSEHALWNRLESEFATADPALWEELRRSAGYPGEAWLLAPVQDYSGRSEELRALVLDLGYELLPNLDLYAQWATFQDFGSGWAPGLRWRPLAFLEAGAEYRVWGEDFVGEFFGRSYDLERTHFIDDGSGGGKLLTKRSRLDGAPAMKGWYADARASLFNLLTVFAAYNTMKPDHAGHPDWNSLWADASLNLSKVPRLTELGAYYTQTGVKSLFELRTPSTVHGLRLGYEMAPGAQLRLNWRTSYTDRDGDGLIRGDAERDRSFAVETVFRLR
jgi:hypothetical protein